MRSARPVLVAHRGDPAHAPENTLTSLESAVAKGARVVEVDVRRTANGVWVAFHDSSLKRTTGLSGRLDQTGWARLAPLGVPSLSQALRFCRRHRVKLFLDLKITGAERALLKLLKKSGGLSQILLGVSHASRLQLWRKLLPRRPLFWVTGYRMGLTPRRIAQARRLKLTGFTSYKRWATAGSLKRVHQAGLQVYVWTVRSRRELKTISALGVDGIMSEVWPPSSI